MQNTWQPSASLENLQLRARMLANIRAFFSERNVLEVETPLMGKYGITDPHIENIPTVYQKNITGFLQSSPEYCMKRLLAAGSGSIYQICKAFRDEECGRRHNPEFTLLEWYRVGFDHHALMEELDLLIQRLLNTPAADKISYRQLFLAHLSLDPFTAETFELQQKVLEYSIDLHTSSLNHDDYLNVLLTHCIEPKLGLEKPIFIYDFPASQASLAKIRQGTFCVGERFELFYQTQELANGFHELNSSVEQSARFKKDQEQRKANHQMVPELDFSFLHALDHLPDCAGVALGIDRLLMLAAKEKDIKTVMSFHWDSL